jgi:plasmid stabilization system protein ParE
VTVVVWTEQALDDVEAVRAFIARDSPRYAQMTVERIVDSVERLQRFPESGRVVPERGDPRIREILAGSYRIVYRLGHEAVEVLTVFHGARLFPLLDA